MNVRTAFHKGYCNFLTVNDHIDMIYSPIPFLSFQGAGISASSVLHGMVFKKETEGDVTSVKDAKIAVYSCPFDGMITETKVC